MARKKSDFLLSKLVVPGNGRRQHHHQYTQRFASGVKASGASSDPKDETETVETQHKNNFTRNRQTVNDLKKSAITIKMPLAIKIGLAIAYVAIPLIFLMFFVVLFGNEELYGGNGLSFGSYYSYECDEITVIFKDKSKNYETSGSGTYPLDEYVAGVVYAEIGRMSKNEEMAKAFALAARTFVLKHVDENCEIESSDRRQVFKDITDIDNEISRATRAGAEATKGQVLIQNNELYPVQYDAFCSIGKENGYYIIKQQEQRIPVEWAESQGIPSAWLAGTCSGNHGRGMSQYGSYYLATEKGYTYDELLEYYYGEEVTISTNSVDESIPGITSVAGLEIKNTTKAEKLNEPITDFLNSKGSSLEDMNDYIYESVVDAGVGTREGVVTAAVSMINYLYDNFNIKFPYYWGGKSLDKGIPSSFGTYHPSATSSGGNVYNKKSFDCSGFVSWAIRNGGYNFKGASTSGFTAFYSTSCNIKDQTCIGQPGDIINYRDATNSAGHVLLILAVDETTQKYFVAHSGGKGVVMEQRDMHAPEGVGTTKIIYMDNYYNNPENIDPKY